ncbi:MAG: hypothetical protein KY476_15585, partial [Planctomycetes bacterium]|nr:hypothetical protein [Planctomycetota bacterium]
ATDLVTNTIVNAVGLAFPAGGFGVVGPGTIIANHGFELQTFDIEATMATSRGCTEIIGSVGVRRLESSQDFRIAQLMAGALATAAVHKHDVEGWGPTLSIDASRPFGDSGLGLYANLRGSVVFADRNQTAANFGAGGAFLASASASTDEVISIGEIGLGIEYDRDVMDATGLVVRAGYEAQVYENLGGPTTINGDVGLSGFVLSIGVNR